MIVLSISQNIQICSIDSVHGERVFFLQSEFKGEGTMKLMSAALSALMVMSVGMSAFAANSTTSTVTKPTMTSKSATKVSKKISKRPSVKRSKLAKKAK